MPFGNVFKLKSTAFRQACNVGVQIKGLGFCIDHRSNLLLFMHGH